MPRKGAPDESDAQANAGTGRAIQPVAFGRDGSPFVALLLEDEREQAAALDALTARLAEPGARVIRVGNPLRASLTLERIMIQVAGPEGEVFAGDDARLIVRAIAERQRREDRIVLVIERAESLHPKVLRSLQAMAPHFAEDGHPTLQVAFIGRPAFRALLDGEELRPLREALWLPGEWATPKPGSASPSRPVPEPEVAAVLRSLPAARRAMAGSPALDIPEMPHVPGISQARKDDPGTASPAGAWLEARPGASVPAGQPRDADLHAAWSEAADAGNSWVRPLVASRNPPDGDASARNGAAAAAPTERMPRRARILVPLLLLFAVSAGMGGAYVGLRGLFYRNVPARATSAAPAPAMARPEATVTTPANPGAALPGPVGPSTAPDAQAEPSPSLPVVTPPPAAAMPVQPADQAARLRRDFDAFLDRSGRNAAALSDAQRGVLFEEFLQWRSQNVGRPSQSGLTPETSATPAPRIVIHVPSGSAATEALSARIAANLGARSSGVQSRRVAEAPSRPTIRYFHADDEAAARRAAAWLSDTGLNWTVRDFSTFQPRPSRGTIEVWVPGQL